MNYVPEEQTMPVEVQHLLGILRLHPGRGNAISMRKLYEAWSGEQIPIDPVTGKPTVDVPTRTRAMRKLIDDLRDIWRIPVMSSTSHGYWIITDPSELADVVHEFQSRGLKSLQTAARLKQTSLIDAVQQLAMELEDGDSALVQRMRDRRRPAPQDTDLGDLVLSPEARMAVITSHLQELLGSPQEYADQIRALQRQFGPRLLPQSVIDEIQRQAGHARDAARQAIEAVDRLQAMVGVSGPSWA